MSFSFCSSSCDRAPDAFFEPSVIVQRQEHSDGEQSLSDGACGSSWKSIAGLLLFISIWALLLLCAWLGWHNRDLLWGSLRKPWDFLLKVYLDAIILNYLVSDIVEVER